MTRIVAMHTPVTIEAADTGTDGKPALPRFSMVAYTGVPMRLGGWGAPVVVDLAGMTIPSQKIPIQADHDMAAGVGHTEKVVVDGGKLLAEGVISRGTPFAVEVVLSSRNGYPWQASIGASADDVEWLKDGLSASVNGQTVTGPMNIVRKSTLGEISFVPLGADSNTSASVAANKTQEGRGMSDLKERRAALIQAHGEAHAGIILAALVDGKDDAEIAAEIQAAQLDALAQRAAKAEADLAAAKEQLAAKDEEIAQLKASQTRQIPSPVGNGETGEEVETITRAQAAKMTKEQLAAFRAGKLKIV